MSTLENVFPDSVNVELNGETFTITPFKVRHMQMYLRTKRLILEKAVKLATDLAPLYPDGMQQDQVPLDLLFERCAPEFVEQVSAALNKPTEWVEELDIDVMTALAGVINELNERKYTSKKAPVLSVKAGTQDQ